MTTRLKSFGLRLKQSLLQVWSVFAVVAITLLLLVPEATGEFMNGIPSLLRYLLVILIFAFLVVFYPQFRVWHGINLQRRVREPVRQADKTDKAETAPLSRPATDPVQEALEARKRRAGLLTTDSEPIHESQTEAPSVDPSIKLADWTQDQDDSEDDFYAMLGQMSKSNSPDSNEVSQSEGSIVDDVLKNRQANSNDQS